MAGGRRRMAVLVIAILAAVGLVVAYFVADSLVRGYAEGRAERAITENLPGTVTGDVTVAIGGVSAIAQYLSGSFDTVVVAAPQLAVDGVPASVQIVATDVPVDTTQPVGLTRGVVDLGPESLNQLLRASGDPIGDGEVQLGDGEVSYTGVLKLLGFEFGYEATATVAPDAGRLVFTPTGAEITTDAGAFDASRIVQFVLGEEPIGVCLAEYLPEGVDVTSVDLTPERARITLESSTLMLTQQSLTTMGTCPAG